MIGEHRCVVDLGPIRVTGATDHLGLLDYLRDFYPLDEHDDAESPAEWTIDARPAAPNPDMTLTPWQVGHHADRDARHAKIRAMDARNLAITTRKAIREVLLDHCEAHRYTMLHASALADDQRVIVVVGDKGSGKTTVALNGALVAGYRYLSNDHLILYRAADGLVVTSLPTPIPIKIGTYLDYAEQLGEPWENEGVDIERYRRMQVRERYDHDRRLLYTYRGLGQSNPVHTALADRRVLVVLASYAPPDQPLSAPVPVEDPGAVLWPHVRFDWVFDPALNTRHLTRTERDRDTYTQDSRNRLAELAAGAQVVRWLHHGRLRPLLDWLDDNPGVQR